MTILYRLLKILLFSRFSTRVGLLEQSKMILRVSLSDLDFLLHMNNARYFALMDLGRLDFLIRSNLGSLLKKQHIYPVVASETIRFRRSLTLFQRFELATRLISWDDKFFYMEQFYLHNNEVVTLALVKIRFLRKGNGGISPSELLQIAGMDQPAPALPEWIANWQQMDQLFYAAKV